MPRSVLSGLFRHMRRLTSRLTTDEMHIVVTCWEAPHFPISVGHHVAIVQLARHAASLSFLLHRDQWKGPGRKLLSGAQGFLPETGRSARVREGDSAHWRFNHPASSPEGAGETSWGGRWVILFSNHLCVQHMKTQQNHHMVLSFKYVIRRCMSLWRNQLAA